MIGTAVPLELLLVALYGLSPQPGGTLADAQNPGSTVFSVLTGTFILVLTTGAAVLMAHMQSPSLLQARQCWYRARVTEIGADDERLMHDTVALAAVLVDRGRPELPPSL